MQLFTELNKNGNYNCVTATALYGLLLNDLGIPFSIKETPEHVYLIAYPKSDAILIESTDPLKGYRVFNDNYKALIVQNLKENKIISESEFKTGNVNNLFDKYFFPRE